MSVFRFRAALFGTALCVMGGGALADTIPVTFAQVTENGSSNGMTWSNNGSGTANFNTTTAGGDLVNFSYQNISGLSPNLQGSLSALMTVNGGAGVTTTAQAGSSSGIDTQAINAPMTISYNLATPINGQTNLLTITIAPNTPGANGMVLFGQNGGTGAASTTSQPTSPPASYTMSFTSSFLSFALNDPITAGYSYSSLTPMMAIAEDGLLANFFAQFTGTFSSGMTPIAVPEPGALALFAVGLIGLAAVFRSRRSAA